jgi:5-methyltetrahydropteroyltriglutamate--homocysteine methyltransferase
VIDGLPLLPVQSIGSAAVPGWIWLVRDAVAAGTLGSADVLEAQRDAAELALRQMTEAGYDIVSDGELLRADFTWNFHDRIDGLERIEVERRLGYPGPDQVDTFRCVRPLTVPDGYGLPAEVEYMRTRTSLPFVTALQSPITQAFRIDPGDVYAGKREIAWALVPFVNREFRAAVAAGAHYVQLDEAAFWSLAEGPEDVAAIVSGCFEGVEATRALHLCFGNFRGRAATSDRSYARIAPHLARVAVDVVHLEFAGRGMAEADLWAEHGGDKVLCAGVVDVKGRTIEPVEVVAERIRILLRAIRPDRLWLASDCGFSQTARPLALGKMRALVQAAELVRGEFAG